MATSTVNNGSDMVRHARDRRSNLDCRHVLFPQSFFRAALSPALAKIDHGTGRSGLDLYLSG